MPTTTESRFTDAMEAVEPEGVDLTHYQQAILLLRETMQVQRHSPEYVQIVEEAVEELNKALDGGEKLTDDQRTAAEETVAELDDYLDEAAAKAAATTPDGK